jgi:hypothetical protein
VPASVYVEAGTIGLSSTECPFDAAYPYSYCRICGMVYQPQFQRATPGDNALKKLQRRDAMVAHEVRHRADGSLREYQLSPTYLSPEAQYRLAPFGIASLSDIALNEGARHAAMTAPRKPALEYHRFPHVLA